MGYFKWYDEDKSKRFLSHHGIKGQKWGIRRFQNKDGTRIKTKDAEYHRYRTGQKKKFDDSKTKSGMSAFLTRAENNRTAHIYLNGNKNEYWPMENGAARWAQFNEGQSFDSSLSVVNRMREKYPDSPDYQNNCVNVATALIDRKKGMAVAAGPNADGIANEAIGYYFDGTKREEPSVSDLESTMRAHGKGSYGILCTKTQFGFGHATVYEVNDDDSITIYGGQSDNWTKGSLDEYKSKIGIQDWGGTCLYDMTNAKPNMAHQAEDHTFFPNEASSTDTFSTSWNLNGRNYTGPSSEDTTFEQRRRMYGV